MRRRPGVVVIALFPLMTVLDPGPGWIASEPQEGASATAVGRVTALIEEGRTAEALSTARRLLADAERTSGPESLPVAEAMDALQLALSRRDSPRPDEQKWLMERAVRIREKVLGADHLDVALNLNTLFRLLISMQKYEEAVGVARRVLSIRERRLPADSLLLGKAVANMALVEWRIGDFSPARRHFDRALSIFRSAGAPEAPDQAILLNNMALLLQALGDYGAARAALERVVKIGERHQSSVPGEPGGGYLNLCRLLRDMGDYDAARRACDRCLEIWGVYPGPDSREMASAIHAKAQLLVATGDDAVARPLIERALAISRSWNDNSNSDYSGHLSVYGRILLHLGDPAGARKQLEEGLHVMGRVFPPGHPEFAEDRVALGEAQWRLGETSAAWHQALGAAAISRSSLRETAAGLSEREALRYESTRLSSMNLLMSLLLFSGPAAAPRQAAKSVLDEQIRSRAIVLDEMADRHHTLSEDRAPDLEPLQSALAIARNRLSRLMVSAGGVTNQNRYRELVRQAEEDRDRAERALADRSADYRRRLRRDSIGLRDVAAALPQRAALVAYVRFERISGDSGARPIPYYMAFILGAGAATPTAIPLGASSAIDETIQRWRREAGSNPELGGRTASEASYRKVGEALRRQIWDPVAAALPDVEMVLVVPDGLLSLVSFATLPYGDGAAYLIERKPLFHYVSAERDLVPDHAARAQSWRLLALGGADFDDLPPAAASEAAAPFSRVSRKASYRSTSPVCLDLRALRFETLEGSLAEVREIESLWSRKGQVLALTGGRAGEGPLKRDATEADVLHIATHAFFMRERCTVAPDGKGPPDSPFLLSGLALAGANARRALPEGSQEEDGILTAEEISALDLSGVGWAVLSACGTGLGDVHSGEGVLGLRRAFEVAGVGTLIMSLWNVEDDATRIWMRGLYEARLDGMRTVEAVSAAGLKMIQERRRVGRTTHPFYWGAFVAAGDWR